ncbi:MAG: hypothetical protein WD894_03815 [Pirellulales bacterium]
MFHLRFAKIILFALAAAIVGVPSAGLAAEPPRIEFEIVTEQGLTPVTTQKWYKTLTDLKVAGLRIRGETSGDQPKIDETGVKDRRVFRVTGRIDSRGTLIVPGGRFTTADAPKIARWIHELSNNGVAGVTERKVAFGLTKGQLAEVTKDLTRPVAFSTKGIKPTDAVQQIVASLRLKATLDDETKRTLLADEPVRDELEGLSSGTALAALLRPAGAALVPLKPDGEPVQYRLIAAQSATEIWPVGWPPKQPRGKVAPKLIELLNAEIDGFSAAEAIEAIRGRLGMPLLFDHNNLVRHRIDLATPITVPARRTYYSKVLDQALFKVGLMYELRVDENEKPILWITTLKR